MSKSDKSPPSSNILAVWGAAKLPPRQLETHYDSRRVLCFEPRPRSLFAMLEAATELAPGSDALVFNDQRISYRQLLESVRCLAGGLSELGVEQGSRVVLLVSNRAEFVIGFFALQCLGAIAVPVSVREQRAGITYIAGQCAATAIIYDAELADRVPLSSSELSLQHWIMLPAQPTGADAGRQNGSQQPAQPPVPQDASPFVLWSSLLTHPPAGSSAVNEQDTAVILYTSGTTGRPKGAMLTHFGIAHSVLHFIGCMNLAQGVRCIMAVPASHVTGLVANILTTVGAAGSLTIMESFHAGPFLALASRERCQFTVLVPAMYKLCLMHAEFDSFDLTSWHAGGYGGAPMPVSTIDELAQRLPGLALMNAYGATETTSPATLMPAHLTRANSASVGQMLPCAHIKVIDDQGQILGPDEVGELCIAGPMVVPGYWADADATAREFVAGYWHSGDLGRIDDNGFVYVLDRKKDMLNRGGYKIYSVEVENVLMAVKGVQEAAVIGQPCEVLGERVHAVVCADPTQITDQQLIAHCRALLADYKVPETILVRLQPLPRNANGKVLKRELRTVLAA